MSFTLADLPIVLRASPGTKGMAKKLLRPVPHINMPKNFGSPSNLLTLGPNN